MEDDDRQNEVRDAPAYSEDGVDVTLIRWMLSLSPAERLQVLQDFADDVWEAGGGDAQDSPVDARNRA